MTIKVYKICLFDGKRIHELYEECARKEGWIREAEKERNDHRRQIRQYGRDFKDLLEQIEDLKGKLRVMCEERDEWVKRYLESEKARKSLGEKLRRAMEDMEELEKRENIRNDPPESSRAMLGATARKDTASDETELSGDRFEVVKKVMDGYMKTEGGAEA